MNKVRLLLTILLLFMGLVGNAENYTNIELSGKGKTMCLISGFTNNFDKQHFIMSDNNQCLLAKTHLFLEGLV